MVFPGCRYTAPGCTGICLRVGLTMSELTGLHSKSINPMNTNSIYVSASLNRLSQHFPVSGTNVHLRRKWTLD